MTILDALKNHQIRYGAGKYFDEVTRPGDCYWIESLDELPEFLAERAESYAGSAFVKFDEELPASVPTDNPAHTWAMALQVGAEHQQVGAIVIWSSDEHERAWRGSRPSPVVSHDEFNIRRAGE